MFSKNESYSNQVCRLQFVTVTILKNENVLENDYEHLKNENDSKKVKIRKGIKIAGEGGEQTPKLLT